MDEAGRDKEKLSEEQRRAMEGMGSPGDKNVVGEGKLMSESDLWKSFGQTAHDRYDFSSGQESQDNSMGPQWFQIQELYNQIVDHLPEFSQEHADQAVGIENQNRDLFGLAATARQRYDELVEDHQPSAPERAEFLGYLGAVIKNLQVLKKEVGLEEST